MLKGFNKTLFFILFFVFSISTNNVNAQRKAFKIDSLLSKYYQYGQFNGTALVVFKGKVIYKKSFGLADSRWNIPNHPNTKYQIGALTEPFTATIIMKLVEQGLIKLESSITYYLPYYKAENGRNVTIQNLLSHTSGIIDITKESNFYSELRLKHYNTLHDFNKEYDDEKLAFEPGTAYYYSNNGYIILGEIIEEVTGKPFEEVLKKYILDTLGMKNTGCYNDEKIIKKLASGYSKTIFGIKNAPYWDMTSMTSAVGLYSTIDDLYLFDQALYNNDFLSENSKTVMYTPSFDKYGNGWIIDSIGLRKNKKFRKVCKQYGTTTGFSSVMYRAIDDNHTIILLDNTNDEAFADKLKPIAENILNILYNNPYTIPKNHLAYFLANIAINNGIEEAVSKYINISNKERDKYDDLLEDDLNQLASSLFRINKTKEALKILKLNASIYPKYYKIYHSFGEIYLNTKFFDLAMENFKNALKLNPKISGEEKLIYSKDSKYVLFLKEKQNVN